MSTGFQPDSASAHRIAASLQEAERFRRAGRASEAERICRELLKTHAKAPAVLNYLALLLRDRGEFNEAARLFGRAIEASPNDAPLHNNLGNLRRRMGDLSGAEESLRCAVALQPVYPEARYNLGIVLKEQGRSDEALPLFRGAVEQRPAYLEALVQIGVLLKDSGEPAEALALFDSAIKMNPQYFDAHYYRGIALTALGRFEDAIATLRTAISLAPANPVAHYALGNALERASRENEALDEFGKAIELGPDAVDAHRHYNALAWQMGRKDLNFKSYAQARARIGDKPDLLLAEAEQRLLQGDAEISEGLLRRAHRIEPARGDIASVLARSLMLQKRFDESIALLKSAMASEPDAVHHQRGLAETLLQAGRSSEAAALIERALALAPYDQTLLALQLLALRELGDSRLDALADLNKFIGIYELPPPPGYSDIASFNRALAEDLANLHTRNVEPLEQTLRGGTQSPGYLFDRPTHALAGLRERIREAVGDYVSALPSDPAHPLLGRKDAEFDFAGAWSCRLRSSGFHSNHVHAQGWISSAYYVSLPDVVADESRQQGWLKFGESSIGLSERDRPERTVKPEVGKLVLFPSYFWHGTVPFASQDARLTVAFDVVPGLVKARAASSAY
jgi:tetratricopeptide (TPR) repeat protein